MTRVPLCFVLMPFGRKPDTGGRLVDFDRVYQELIAPAIAQAGLEPLRADQEMTGDTVHTPMVERLILCECAIVDLTTANANVFYDLGLRHAVRSSGTVPIFAGGGSRMPFDVGALDALPYTLTAAGTPGEIEMERTALADRLAQRRGVYAASQIYHLVEAFPDIQRLKTDVFRDRVHYSPEVKQRLAVARDQDVDAVRAVDAQIGDIAGAESGVVIDLLLSYRAVKGWSDMIALVDRMAPPLAATVLVREQLGLALTRAGRDDEAERVLTLLITERGPSSETCSILGRMYKDRWDAAVSEGERSLASKWLDQAIGAYLSGFESDWRDAYPGINTVTLMELRDPPDPRRDALIPVVRYAVQRRIAAGNPDYWDHATLLELAVLARDEAGATEALATALADVRESWEPETTARNLRLIREARERRQEPWPRATEIEEALLRRSR